MPNTKIKEGMSIRKCNRVMRGSSGHKDSRVVGEGSLSTQIDVFTRCNRFYKRNVYAPSQLLQQNSAKGHAHFGTVNVCTTPRAFRSFRLFFDLKDRFPPLGLHVSLRGFDFAHPA